MTSEGRGTNERVEDRWVGGSSTGRSTEMDSNPGHLLLREQLWTPCPWEEGHSQKLCILYRKARLSFAAFTLHRSAITKPIKKPRRDASAVSQSPRADLATRIIAQESSFQHRIKRIPAITSEYLHTSSSSPTDVATHEANFNLPQMQANGCNSIFKRNGSNPSWVYFFL